MVPFEDRGPFPTYWYALRTFPFSTELSCKIQASLAV